MTREQTTMAEETRILRLTLTERDAEILSGVLAHMTLSLESGSVNDSCVTGMLLGQPCSVHDKHLISKMTEIHLITLLRGRDECFTFLRKTSRELFEFTAPYRRAKYPDPPDTTPTVGKEVKT